MYFYHKIYLQLQFLYYPLSFKTSLLIFSYSCPNITKKSFYSFLALYIISSLVFTVLSAYWYYTAQKNMFESNQHYKLQHIADTISQGIIHSHMQGEGLQVPSFDDDVIVALISVNKEVVYGSLMEDFFPNKMEYFDIGEYSV